MSVQELRDRVERAKEREIEKLYPYLIDVAEVMVQNRHDAEDIVQDAWVKVLESTTSYDPSKGATYRTWVTAFVISEALDFLRSPLRKIFASLSDEDVVLEVERKYADDQKAAGERRDIRLDVTKVVKRLSAEEQRVIDLIWNKGFTFDEILDKYPEYNRSRGKLERIHERAKRNLRPHLMEYLASFAKGYTSQRESHIG